MWRADSYESCQSVYVFLSYRQFIRRIFWCGQRFPSLERGKSLLSGLQLDLLYSLTVRRVPAFRCGLQLDHDCCTLCGVYQPLGVACNLTMTSVLSDCDVCRLCSGCFFFWACSYWCHGLLFSSQSCFHNPLYVGKCQQVDPGCLR